ncbi:MAG: hypothetical protein NC489_44455, partial [Ruminococcus flavefaciens]|nr:hypothetical protein [Ruminococcus flavefaciens]
YTFHEDLIQVPFAIKSPEMDVREDKTLISIKELNNVIIGLMNRKPIQFKEHNHIKVLRSEIYNPDFIFLYRKAQKEHDLLAFEVFIFEEGYKLAVYADGATELYLTEGDLKIEDIQNKKRLLNQIKEEITVCNPSAIL